MEVQTSYTRQGDSAAIHTVVSLALETERERQLSDDQLLWCALNQHRLMWQNMAIASLPFPTESTPTLSARQRSVLRFCAVERAGGVFTVTYQQED